MSEAFIQSTRAAPIWHWHGLMTTVAALGAVSHSMRLVSLFTLFVCMRKYVKFIRQKLVANDLCKKK